MASNLKSAWCGANIVRAKIKDNIIVQLHHSLERNCTESFLSAKPFTTFELFHVIQNYNYFIRNCYDRQKVFNGKTYS